MFKRKIWTETNRFFTAPVNRAIKSNWLTNYDLMKLANCYTTIEFTDQYGNLRTHVILGDATERVMYDVRTYYRF